MEKVSLDYRHLHCLSTLKGELAIIHGHLVIIYLQDENVEYMTIFVQETLKMTH